MRQCSVHLVRGANGHSSGALCHASFFSASLLSASVLVDHRSFSFASHHTKTGTHVKPTSGTPMRRPSTTDGKDLRIGMRDDERVVG